MAKKEKNPKKLTSSQTNEFVALERKWQSTWEKEKTYSFDPNRKGSVYSIDTPPPTVSGRMHMGHAFSYSHADFIARYKRMQGFNVFYPFGLDDNGLATERLVEKSRNIRAKDFTRDKFIKICLEETRKHEDAMISDFKSIGLSVDWALLYRTIEAPARKASQASFIEIYRNGRAYRKEAPSMWCPTCETAVAQAELEDVESDTTFNDIIFKLDNGKDLAIATTRPELLPSCVAVFINPGDKRKNELIGRKAKVPLFGYNVPILEDRRVDMTKGTGIVMCCTFGDQTDMEWYFAHNLPMRTSLSPNGKMTKLSGKYEGMKIRDARKEILDDLRTAKLLLGQKPIRHAVKVHERCKTEIEIMNTKQWFIKYLDLKEEFLKKGNELRWHPEHMKTRYNNWINGLQWDWSLSRQRFFGVPFPVWYCTKCGQTVLANEKDLPVDPLQDSPTTSKCQNCGSTSFEAEKDVLDTWATSSLTPQINSKWKVDEVFYKNIFPMSLRPQAHDIITLWAFNTIVKSYFHAKKLPWSNIMVSGHALDSKGRKMSKSLGNVINPSEMIEKYSADMLRYWAATGSLGDDLPLQEKEFVAAKKFLTKLSNAAKFVTVKAENIYPSDLTTEMWKLREVDRWILHKFSLVKKEATRALEEYEYSKAFMALKNFFWNEFADFYIEEVKYRVYNDSDTSSNAARIVLVKVMTELLKCMAPFIPHATEELFQSYFRNQAKEKSIHLEKWPSSGEEFLDANAYKSGEIAKEIIASLRKYKTEKGLSINAEIGETTVYIEKDQIFAEKVLEDVKQTMKITEIKLAKGTGSTEAGKGLRIEVK